MVMAATIIAGCSGQTREPVPGPSCNCCPACHTLVVRIDCPTRHTNAICASWPSCLSLISLALPAGCVTSLITEHTGRPQFPRQIFTFSRRGWAASLPQQGGGGVQAKTLPAPRPAASTASVECSQTRPRNIADIPPYWQTVLVSSLERAQTEDWLMFLFLS